MKESFTNISIAFVILIGMAAIFSRIPQASISVPPEPKPNPKQSSVIVGTPQGKQISIVQMGDKYPFTELSGRLLCENNAVTFTAPDGTEYAVNGTADATGRYKDIDPIWKDDDRGYGKVSLAEVVQTGLELCK